jgi:hypothetical protein
MTTPTTTAPPHQAVIDLIRAAGAEIDTHGWYQGDLVSDTGCLCVIGALRRAAGVSPLEEPDDPALLWEAERELARPLQLAGEVPAGAHTPIEVLSLWNDAAGRTVEEVRVHLDAVADDLAGQVPTAAGR